MQPRAMRILRPEWINPFTRKSGGAQQSPIFEGWLRAAPFHRWNLVQISHVLELISKEPGLFGFPARPTCVVNVTHMLPSARSRQSGITVFGTERGCKTVVIPPSCSQHPFDSVDAKLIEPLFRWNPSVEILFLSKSCEPIAHEIGPWLKPLRQLKRVVLVDWEEPKAVNRIVMNCKNLEVLDTVCPDEQMKQWNNANAIQNLTELIEMHQHLKAVEATTDYLGAFNHAIEFSRCKHNVALIGKWCRFARLYRAGWMMGIIFSCLAMGIGTSTALLRFEIRPEEKDWLRDFGPPVLAIVAATTIIVLDHFRFKHTGRRWTYYVRYIVLIRRRFGEPTVTYNLQPHKQSRGKAVITKRAKRPAADKEPEATQQITK